MRRPIRIPLHLPAWAPHATAGLLVAVLVLALASVSIWQERQRRIERSTQSVDNTTRLLEAHLTDSLDKIDLTLQRLIDDLDQAGADPRPQLPMLDYLQQLEGITFRVLDLQGRQLLPLAGRAPAEQSRLAPATLASLREQLLAPRAAGADSGLLVRGPLPPVAGDRWHMLLARAGRLPGTPGMPMPPALVVAEVSVDELGRLLAEIDLGPDSAKTLRSSPDLALIYRDPWPNGDRRQIGGNQVSAQLRGVLQQHPNGGNYIAATAIDGIARINAYRRLPHYPVYVLVGMPLQLLPTSWRQPEAYTVLLALLTIGLTAGLLVRLYRTSQRRVDAAERRYAAIVQSSRDAIISKTTDGIVTSWNPAAQQMFGYSAREMIGQPLLRLLPPERQGEEDDILARIRRNEVIDSFETVRLRKDGSHLDVSVTISPVLDAAGRVIGASKIARDISRHKAAEEAIRRLAYHDTLTGLPNRRLLLDRLRHAMTLSQRSQSHAALLFIDLDRFKQLNDTHGHEAGDALLIAVAERLQGLVRESDTVARYGGDEFIVLCENLGPLPDAAAAHARTTADKIGAALGAEFPLGALTHQGGASVGVHLFLGDAQDMDSLLKAADAAMYRTKMARRASRQVETADGR
ncbi:MAG: hypothetical protein RLY71_631 [Pseudomonadota bacterium]|jgi:diguanylate cyclase (GGDEF)-like protein/PAS domain S-box-containing protein